MTSNRSRWFAHALAMTKKLIRNAMNDGRMSRSTSTALTFTVLSGTRSSNTSNVIAIANTPSDNVSTRARFRLRS